MTVEDAQSHDLGGRSTRDDILVAAREAHFAYETVTYVGVIVMNRGKGNQERD